MNIAAVMAALAIADLDHTAKMVVVVVACRADQHTGVAVIPPGRLPADLSCHWRTVQRAVGRAVDAGYLTIPSRWEIALTGVTNRAGHVTDHATDRATNRATNRPLSIVGLSKDEEEADGATPPHSGGAARPGDNLPAARPDFATTRRRLRHGDT